MKIFNWFDLLVVVLLAVGIFHGRKRGMSLELLPLFELLVIVVVGAKIYSLFGTKLSEWTNGTMSLLASFIGAYILFGLVTHMIFTRLKRAVGEKLVGGDIFGSMEYYFGMAAGMLRYACYIMIGLALLNAKPIDEAKEKAYRKTEKDNLGNIQFPTTTSIQINVFNESRVGSFSRSHLADLLIAPTAPNAKAPKREAIARKREKAVDEVISGTTSPPSTAPKAQ
ncbi:MAG: CvpA family protein [Verrucomicrobia bacterium]|nr:CvpA family protein [Verrucomicrobiota bacterium]